MTKEEIEAEAYRYALSMNDKNMIADIYCSKYDFQRGAEWMDEQYTKICVMETSSTDNVSDNDLIEECKRRGIFVKLRNEMIEKAYKEVRYILNNELKDNDTLSSDWVNDLIEVVAIKLRQEMKGE